MVRQKFNDSLCAYISARSFQMGNLYLQVPNDAIMKCTNYTDFTGKEFNSPDMDKTVRGKESEDPTQYQKA